MKANWHAMSMKTLTNATMLGSSVGSSMSKFKFFSVVILFTQKKKIHENYFFFKRNMQFQMIDSFMNSWARAIRITTDPRILASQCRCLSHRGLFQNPLSAVRPFNGSAFSLTANCGWCSQTGNWQMRKSCKSELHMRPLRVSPSHGMEAELVSNDD